MSKYYCSSCGAATEYTYNIPKFCSSCGAPSGSSTSSVASSKPVSKSPVVAAPPSRVSKRPVFRRQEDEEHYDENDIHEVPTIDKLEVEIFAERPPAETFGDVAKQQKTGFTGRREKYTKKKLKEEFYSPVTRATPINIGDDE